jgi:lipid-A-disaccharide synthase
MDCKNIMIIAGEASGDSHSASLMRSMRVKNSSLRFYGMGGKNMVKEGLEQIFDSSQVAVYGIVEILGAWRKIRRAWKLLTQSLLSDKPDLLILVDYGGFNLRFAKFAHKHGVKILYYISPQVWASRSGRIETIKQVVDKLVVIYPFEKQIYAEHDLEVDYVGSPLVDQVKSVGSQQAARQLLYGSNFAKYQGDKIITLAPGSRKSELKNLLSTMVDSAAQLKRDNKNLSFIVPVASSVDKNIVSSYFNNSGIQPLFTENNYAALEASDVVIGASGTLTLECAILNKPIVVIYKLNKITYFILNRIAKIPYIAMCNIIADKFVVPELVQNQCTVHNICHEVTGLLHNKNKYRNTVNDLQQISKQLGDGGAVDKVARIALTMLNS